MPFSGKFVVMKSYDYAIFFIVDTSILSSEMYFQLSCYLYENFCVIDTSAFVFSIWILATNIISHVKRTFRFENCKGHFNHKLHISLYMSIKTKVLNVRQIIPNNSRAILIFL